MLETYFEFSWLRTRIFDNIRKYLVKVTRPNSPTIVISPWSGIFLKRRPHRRVGKVDGQLNWIVNNQMFVRKIWRTIKHDLEFSIMNSFIISALMQCTLTTHVFVWFLSFSTLLGDTNLMFLPSTLLLSNSPLSWSRPATDLAGHWSAFLQQPCQVEWSLLR